MSTNYGVYPFEPTVFETVLEVSLKNQFQDIDPVESNFAGFSLKKVSNVDTFFKNATDFLKKIKQSDSVSLRVQELVDEKLISGELTVSLSLNNNSLASIDRLLDNKLIMDPNFEFLELQDLPSDMKMVDALLSKLDFPNVCLHTNLTLKEMIDSKFTTKPHAFSFDQYGLCVSDKSSKLSMLYNYFIDTKRLREVSDKIEPIKLHISETDSICSNMKEISNTFGSCIWLLDFLFQVALGNVHRAFVTYSKSNFYALAAFSYATRNNAVFYDYALIHGVKIQPNVSVYITKNIKEYNITVIHKDSLQENVQIKLKLPTKTVGTVIRLQSNQTEMTINGNGVTLGEFTFINNDLKDVGMNHSEKDLHGATIRPEENVYSFVVSKMSAAILTVPIEFIGGAFFENINDDDEENTIVTMRPDAREEDSIPTTMTLKQFREL
jgi:hypothetical protein